MGLCGCDLILPLINGPATIFKDFKETIGMKTTIHDGNKFIEESISRIINSIINREQEYNKCIRLQIFDYLFNTYKWESITNKFRNLIHL